MEEKKTVLRLGDFQIRQSLSKLGKCAGESNTSERKKCISIQSTMAMGVIMQSINQLEQKNIIYRFS